MKVEIKKTSDGESNMLYINNEYIGFHRDKVFDDYYLEIEDIKAIRAACNEFLENDRLQPEGLGIYRIWWKSGGTSIASVGQTHDGTRWFAPANWTSNDNINPIVASTDWSKVKRFKRLSDLTTKENGKERELER